MKDGQPADRNPPALSIDARLGSVQNDVSRTRTRIAGEEFGLNAARLLTDVRSDASPKDVVEVLFDPAVPEARRVYAYQQLNDQEQLGRTVDVRQEQWIRSSFDDVDRPTTGQVEVAMSVPAPALQFTSWDTVLIDLKWSEGRWVVTNFGNGRSGPKDGKSLDTPQRRDFLEGAGWRRLPPRDA